MEQILEDFLKKLAIALKIALKRLPEDKLQEIMENRQEEVVGQIIDAVNQRVDEESQIVTRRVLVNRNRGLKEMLEKFLLFKKDNSLKEKDIPLVGFGTGEKEEYIYFLPLDFYTAPEDIEMILEKNNLVYADIYEIFAVNEADHVFCKDHPNFTQWKTKDGTFHCYCFAKNEKGFWLGSDWSPSEWSPWWWVAGKRAKKQKEESNEKESRI